MCIPTLGVTYAYDVCSGRLTVGYANVRLPLISVGWVNCATLPVKVESATPAMGLIALKLTWDVLYGGVTGFKGSLCSVCQRCRLVDNPQLPSLPSVPPFASTAVRGSRTCEVAVICVDKSVK